MNAEMMGNQTKVDDECTELNSLSLSTLCVGKIVSPLIAGAVV